ncbi:MAG: hypothetical protein M3P85_09810 [Actinomycetota bacterium]|nr:hypothetical protein [Actinomycetota bacterium]
MFEYRHALRQALAGLNADRGRVLLGRYASADTRRCDVENLLLYNVGVSAFAHLRPQQVVLVRSLTTPPPPEGDRDVLVHHHRYDLVGSEPPAPAGDVLVRFGPVPLRRPLAVEKVWYDVRSSGRLAVKSASRGDQLALDLTVHRPAGAAAPSMLGMVKVLVDGVVSALHTHDGTQLEVLADRLSQRLCVPGDQLADLLTDSPVAVLDRRRLLWPFQSFVQWNPADDAIVDLRVTAVTSTTWQLSGALAAVQGTAYPSP